MTTNLRRQIVTLKTVRMVSGETACPSLKVALKMQEDTLEKQTYGASGEFVEIEAELLIWGEGKPQAFGGHRARPCNKIGVTLAV